MIGQFVISKAGHDKDEVYIIIEENDKQLLLSDGEYKKTGNPKRKNRKHVSFTTEYLKPEQTEKLKLLDEEANLLIKRESRRFKKKG